MADQLTSEKGHTATVVCPVCGMGGAQVYLDKPDPDNAAAFGSSRKDVSCGTILRCVSCRFGYRRVRSNQEEMAEVYRRMDTRVYRSEQFARDRTAATHLRIVHRYVQGGHILDVGCAAGLFLRHAADAGWRITGLEPSEQLFPLAEQNLAGRGVVYSTTFEQAHLAPGFDVITLWDVLEHVPDPLRFLTACRDLLTPGGYLFLNVPDLDSIQARVMGSHWPLFLAEHLNYFNRPSLRLCGEKAGLSLVHFGRRSVWFSLEYTTYRMTQHEIPFSRLLRELTSRLGHITLPLLLGETYAVFRRPYPD
jgi:2-polyprenyl-3-methyl-5-hydroxy-6-metoxy-1,4-benzoquinol methylase